MIYNRIREFRIKKNITQQELARLVGLDYTHIGRIETGKRTLDIEYLEVFAKALGVKPYELLPKEWQPQEITDEEREILELFRKKFDALQDSREKNDKTNRYKTK